MCQHEASKRDEKGKREIIPVMEYIGWGISRPHAEQKKIKRK